MPNRNARTNPRLDPRWVATRFDRVAWCYRFIERFFMVPRNARALALQQLSIRPGDRVLSIGCGEGRGLEALSKAAGPGGRVVGIDLSSAMVKKARERTCGLGNIDLHRRSLFQVGAEERFDRMCFEFSLSSFGAPQAALRHSWELLQPGGSLVVLDARMPPRLSFLTRPLLPVIRWLLERTVLGDPDMDASEELRQSGITHAIRWFCGGTYFVACAEKPGS